MRDSFSLQNIFSALKDVWLILGVTIFLLVLGHYILGGVVLVKSYFKPQWIDPRVHSPVYSEFPDKEAFWREETSAWNWRFEPYVHWRSNPVSGRFINIDSRGNRLTVKDNPKVDATKIFMFGGSTLWGTGSPDNATIPSIVQGILGNDFDVYNFAETAYVSTQELNLLLSQLSSRNIPDIVIFYDGVNDGYAGAYSPAIPRDPYYLREEYRNRRNEASETLGELASRLFLKSNYRHAVNYFQTRQQDSEKNLTWDKSVKQSLQKNKKSVIDMYEAHIMQVKALSNQYGFRAFFFWQPNLFSLTRNMNAFEQKIVAESSEAWISSQQQIYLDAKIKFSNRESDGIFFIGNLFDNSEEPIYIDWCHIGPNGNEIVAKAIIERLHGQL